MNKSGRITILFLVLVTHLTAQKFNRSPLYFKWEFRQKGTWGWHSKNVTGNVHLDLLANGIIKEPYYADNEKNLKWIENEDWEYKTEYAPPPDVFQQKHIELTFAGLDTYASVYLNDSLILKADNMFREWTVDVKKLLKAKNTIYILFESAIKKGKQEAEKITYTLPEGERVFTRKAQYQYGWDWGPRFVTAGIWKPIYLNAWSDIKLLDVHYEITQLDSSLAKVNVIYETNCEVPGKYQFICNISGNKPGSLKDKIRKSKEVQLKKGTHADTLTCLIPHPKLWWCNGMGESFLYRLSCDVFYKQFNIQKRSMVMGLRKIELLQKPDPIGRSFYFKINGVPVFIKGANYIPPGNFLFHDIGEYVNPYPAIAKNLHMNMLRVWGGGVYESDNFYEECDKNGILVWQDLMFACAMYPGDNHFTNNVLQEINDQARRLRNHPSLALWCGNNEVDEGWKNWGWQKQHQYSHKDSTEISNNYIALFENKIPQLLRQTDSKRTYLSSSPSIGWGHKESLTQGDSHYWGVWWGMEPFSVYQKKVGRFVSEYGFQSMPNLSTFKEFCPPEELNLSSTSVLSHQKHNKGFQTIYDYMQRDYKVPTDFRHYIYTSQLLQRDGMTMAIEAHRSSKMYCMGTLFWQFNDCWPVTSWSAIDSEGGKKAFFYSLQKTYNTFLVTVLNQKEIIRVSAVSDTLPNLQAALNIKLLDFSGKTIWQQQSKMALSNTMVQSHFIEKSKLPAFDTSLVFLNVELVHNNKILATKNYYFSAPKNLKLPKAELIFEGDSVKGYTVKSNVLAKDVYLFSQDDSLEFAENYFDLLPGETKPLTFKNLKGNDIIKRIQYIVLNNL